MAIVTDNLLYHLNAGLAKNGTAAGNNNDPVSNWYELVEGVNEGTLTDFAWTTSDGWAGSGTNEDPYCLVNADTSYVGLAADSNLGAAPFTIELWYYCGSAPGANSYVYGNHTSYTGVSYFVAGTTGNSSWRVGNGVDYDYVGGGGAGSGASWRMVSLRFNGTNLYAYVNTSANGTAVECSDFDNNTGASRLFSMIGGGSAFVGKISALRIYGADIGTAGISQNYAEGPTEGLQSPADSWGGITVTKHLP